MLQECTQNYTDCALSIIYDIIIYVGIYTDCMATYLMVWHGASPQYLYLKVQNIQFHKNFNNGESCFFIVQLTLYKNSLFMTLRLCEHYSIQEKLTGA